MPWNRVLRINDPLQCRSAFEGTDFEVIPTARGNFRAEVTQIHLNRLRMARYHLSLPQVSAVTLKPDRTVIGFLTDPSSSLRYCGTQISPGDLIINRPDAAHQRTDTHLSSGTLSLSADDLNATLEGAVGHDFLKRLDRLVIRPSEASMLRLLMLHKAVGQLAHDTPELLAMPEVCRALEEQLIHLAVECLAEGAGIERTTGGLRNDAILARFEDYLAAHPNQPLYLTEICAAMGIAERTLRAACEEHLGMGPIRFLSLRRMHLVRRTLLQSDPSRVTVTRIVTDHGFWEFGRFSVAYRALFGEKPSETLRRPAEQSAIDLIAPLSLVRSEFRVG